MISLDKSDCHHGVKVINCVHDDLLFFIDYLLIFPGIVSPNIHVTIVFYRHIIVRAFAKSSLICLLYVGIILHIPPPFT